MFLQNKDGHACDREDLADGSCQRLSLAHGLPESLGDLMTEVKKQCNLEGNIRLQFMDSLGPILTV